MIPTKECFCEIDAFAMECQNFDYEEIFATMPDICDVTLSGNDSPERIPASKIILASLGPIFDSLLDESEVKLDYPLATVRAIQEFAQTGQLRCDDINTAAHLLRAAKKFDLIGVKYLAGNYLFSQINDENIFKIYELSQELLCHHSVAWIRKSILQGFSVLGQSPTFLQSCRATWLENFLMDDELNVAEEEIFSILQNWAMLSPANSEAFLHLVELIRLPLIRPDFFNQVVKTSKLLQGTSAVKKMEQLIRRHNSKLSRFRFKPNYRLPFELVFAVGGFGSQPLSDLEVFDIRARKWTKVEQCFPPHAYHGLVADDLHIHILGGYGGNGGFISAMLTFSLLEKKCSITKRFLATPRCYISVAEMNSEIYCIGGFNGTTRLRSVEKFDEQKQSWTEVSEMKSIRSDASAVTYNNKIFVVGGYTGAEVLNSIEVYNPDKNEWNYGPTLNIPRTGLKAVVLEDKLYAVGGFNGTERLTSVETLDLRSPNPAWTLSSNLNIRRSNFGIAVLHKAILVAGGFDGEGVTDECEIFDLKTNSWELAPKMNVKKSALSLVSIQNLPNRKEYLPYWKTT